MNFADAEAVSHNITANLPIKHRSAMAKFGFGVAPIRLETGRYERIPVENRLCIPCNTIESETHVICECPLYQDLRNTLFETNHSKL